MDSPPPSSGYRNFGPAAMSSYNALKIGQFPRHNRRHRHAPAEDSLEMSSPSRVPTYVMQQRSELTDFYIRDKKGRRAETSPHRHEYFQILSLIHI